MSALIAGGLRARSSEIVVQLFSGGMDWYKISLYIRLHVECTLLFSDDFRNDRRLKGAGANEAQKIEKDQPVLLNIKLENYQLAVMKL